MQERKDRHTNGIKIVFFNPVNIFRNHSDSCNAKSTWSGWDGGKFLNSSSIQCCVSHLCHSSILTIIVQCFHSFKSFSVSHPVPQWLGWGWKQPGGDSWPQLTVKWPCHLTSWSATILSFQGSHSLEMGWALVCSWEVVSNSFCITWQFAFFLFFFFLSFIKLSITQPTSFYTLLFFQFSHSNSIQLWRRLGANRLWMLNCWLGSTQQATKN